jgi:hypothetical protein
MEQQEVGVPGSRSGKAPLGLQAHAGFLNSAKELLPHVFDRISKCLEACPTSNILFTGHSAGGAVVTLLHLAALNRFASTGKSQDLGHKLFINFSQPPMPHFHVSHLALRRQSSWCLK